jgi:hypothetical protein
LRLLGVLVMYPVSRRPVRPLADEAMRSLPGDELVTDARIRWNHAITIRARPADIWPWLVQMGCRRAGWYSYDGLDNGGVPSAERIVPELQRVQVGDIFPMTPKAQDRFVVRVAEPGRALVLDRQRCQRRSNFSGVADKREIRIATNGGTRGWAHPSRRHLTSAAPCQLGGGFIVAQELPGVPRTGARPVTRRRTS